MISIIDILENGENGSLGDDSDNGVGAYTAFKKLNSVVLACRNCALCDSRINAVYGRGEFTAKIVVIGEAPGADEDLSGLPFVGKAGKILDEVLARAISNKYDVKIKDGYDLIKDNFYITNVVKCRPPKNRRPTKQEILTCKGYIIKQIELIRPQYILCIGRTALDFVKQYLVVTSQELMSADSLESVRGKLFNVKLSLQSNHTMQAMATYHTSPLNNVIANYTDIILSDVSKLLSLE